MLSGIMRDRLRHFVHSPKAALLSCCVGLFCLAPPTLAAAQDIRGLEICTAEKQMERRTGCLQSNVEFLQQVLTKLARETQDKTAAADRNIAAAQAEIAELKATVAKLNAELAQIKTKIEPGTKK
jgi:septal ring factor EnvC (AmiA/AmiB activator)